MTLQPTDCSPNPDFEITSLQQHINTQALTTLSSKEETLSTASG